MREAGIVMSQAVLIAVGIDWDGRRQILAVEMANRESRSAWRDFLVGLKARGLKGVELVVSDDHAGLVAAIGEVIPEPAWQRCYVGLLRKPVFQHLFRDNAGLGVRTAERPRQVSSGLVNEVQRVHQQQQSQESVKQSGS